jgi:hypothetical protein
MNNFLKRVLKIKLILSLLYIREWFTNMWLMNIKVKVLPAFEITL